jgi:hypothetical protein
MHNPQNTLAWDPHELCMYPNPSSYVWVPSHPNVYWNCACITTPLLRVESPKSAGGRSGFRMWNDSIAKYKSLFVCGVVINPLYHRRGGSEVHQKKEGIFDMTLRLACSSRSAMRFLLENQSYLLCLAPRLCTFLFVSEPFWQPYGQYLWSGIKHKPSPRRPRRPRVVLSSFSAIQKENVRHCNNIVISVIPSDSNQTGMILRTQLKIATLEGPHGRDWKQR